MIRFRLGSRPELSGSGVDDWGRSAGRIIGLLLLPRGSTEVDSGFLEAAFRFAAFLPAAKVSVSASSSDSHLDFSFPFFAGTSAVTFCIVDASDAANGRSDPRVEASPLWASRSISTISPSSASRFPLLYPAEPPAPPSCPLALLISAKVRGPGKSGEGSPFPISC